jgi:hypothetical protein
MSTEQTTTVAALQKHEPAFRLPDNRALGSLTSGDRCLLERLVVETTECIFNPLFDSDSFESLLEAGPPVDADLKRSCEDSGVDMLFLNSTDGQVLPIDEERFTFLRFNYARYRVMRIVRSHEGKKLSAGITRELLKWERKVMNYRNEIVSENMPLVLAMVKRTRVTGVDYSDLISEGNMALMRSVDKFDCSRGYKFSTYALPLDSQGLCPCRNPHGTLPRLFPDRIRSDARKERSR